MNASNITLPTNITNIVEMTQYANNATGSLLAYLIILAVFLIAFMNLKQYSFAKATLASLFITTLFAATLAATGLISATIGIMLALLTGIAFIANFMSN